MVTEQVQKESDNRFSDAVMASRELQNQGVEVDDQDLSVEKRILVRDNRSKTNALTGDMSKIHDPAITYEDVERTVDADRAPRPLRNSWVSNLIELSDIRSDTSSRTKGVIVEEDDGEYIYPVKVTYIVRIDPSDPIIDKEYYVKADSKSEAEQLVNQISSSDQSYLKSSDTDVNLTAMNKVREGEGIFNYVFASILGSFWAASAFASLMTGSMTLLFILEAFCAVIWFVLATRDLLHKKEEEDHFHAENADKFLSDLNLSDFVRKYKRSRSKREKVSFHVTGEDTVTCVSESSGITWTLSDDGMVPESIVSELENIGFSGVDSPVYNADIKPVELVDEKDSSMISDCRQWYLELDSAESVTD